MRHGRDRAAAEGGRNVGHRLLKVKVGAATPEEVEQVFAEGLVQIGSHRGVSARSDSVSTAECGLLPNLSGPRSGAAASLRSTGRQR